MPRDINELKARLGNDIPWSSRLTEALTHRSYAVENSLSYDNQRLEFLGDAVLEIVLTDYLFRLYPDCDEGAMTKIRSALVREPALARLARKLELGEYLLVGRGEKESGGAGAIRRWPISLRRCSERSTSMPDSRRSKNSSPGCSRRNTRTRARSSIRSTRRDCSRSTPRPAGGSRRSIPCAHDGPGAPAGLRSGSFAARLCRVRTRRQPQAGGELGGACVVSVSDGT